MFKVLLAYDGTPHSVWALSDLRRSGLPADCEAEVLTLAEYWLPVAATGVHPTALTTGIQLAYARAERELKYAGELAERGAGELRAAFPGWQIHARGMGVTPAWGIVERATEWHPDLVVLGSHSRGNVERVLIGSVAQTVLTHVTCSVRIARMRHGNVHAPPRILIGADGSSGAENALRAVCARRWPADSTFRVVYCHDDNHGPLWQRLPGASSWMKTLNEDDDAGKRILERAAHQLAAAGLRSEHEILHAPAKRALVEDAANWRADCLFVGARGMSAVQRLFLGSVSTSISAHAPCTVEVVR